MMELFNFLPPLGSHKNPVTAFIIGYLTGGLGLMFYFWSLPDFFACLLIGLFLFAMIPVDILSGGLALLVVFAIPGLYGYMRAGASNKKRGE